MHEIFLPSPVISGQVQAGLGWTWQDLQVQRVWAKSSAFCPSPAPLGQVQHLWAKSSHFSSSPGLLVQVQAFGAKSSRFGPSPGVLGQVQASRPKSARSRVHVPKANRAVIQQEFRKMRTRKEPPPPLHTTTTQLSKMLQSICGCLAFRDPKWKLGPAQLK